MDQQRGQARSAAGSIIGLLQMTATPEKGNIHFDGGVALGGSGLFIQTYVRTSPGCAICHFHGLVTC